MDFKSKAETMAEKMNKLTQSLDLSEDLLVEGDDIVEYVEEKTKDITIADERSYADIMNLKVMTEDFQFVRSTLKEVTENARRVQNAITMELLGEDSEGQASLIVSFSELSKAITDAQKLYVLSYKEMSTTLLNLDKIKKAEKHEKGNEIPSGGNHVHFHSAEPLSPVEVLERLRNKKNE